MNLLGRVTEMQQLNSRISNEHISSELTQCNRKMENFHRVNRTRDLLGEMNFSIGTICYQNGEEPRGELQRMNQLFQMKMDTY